MSDTAQAILVMASILVPCLLIRVCVLLSDCLMELRSIDRSTTDLMRFSLNPRTRIGGRVAPKMSAATEVDELREVGRQTAGKRVVFGGDPESELNRKLEGRP